MLEPDDRLTERFPTGEATALVGRTIAGKYEIISLVAKGGMGAVYKAIQHPLGRVVAIKVLHLGDRSPSVLADPTSARAATRENTSARAAARENTSARAAARENTSSARAATREYRERFVREAAAVARLKNPHTVTLYDYGQLDDSQDMFMALEFVRGRTLREVLESEGRLTVVRTVAIALQVARSLREAHRQGVVHRDLKPSNIMLVAAEEGEGEEFVKVVDFGLAKGIRAEAGLDATTPLPGELDGVLGLGERTLTARGVVIGSPGYIPPEQIRDEEVDHRADIYTLGCVMFECLTGTVPFRGRTKMEAYLQQVQGLVPWIHEVNAEVVVPDEVERLVRRCLARQPSDRFQDAQELIDALKACVPPSELDADGFLPLVRASEHRVAPGEVARGPSWPMAVALLAVGVALGWAAGGSWAAPPEVSIATEPVGAEVWEAGRLVGVTPLIVQGHGSRTLLLKLEGFADRSLVVEPGDRDQQVLLELRRVP